MDLGSPYKIKFKMPYSSVHLLENGLLDWCYANLGCPGSEESWEWYTWVEGRYCVIVFNSSEVYNKFVNSETYLLYLINQ